MLERLSLAVSPIAQVKSSILLSITGVGVPEYLIGAYQIVQLRLACSGVLGMKKAVMNDLRIHNEIYDIVDRCEKIASNNVIEFGRLVALEIERLLSALKHSQPLRASDKMVASLEAIKAGCDKVVTSGGSTLIFAYTV